MPLRPTTIAATLAASVAIAGLATSPVARADTVAYLVNVTVRPGYNFPSPEAALNYGYGICDHVREAMPYARTIATVMTDFATDDDYQAVYLVNQAVNELCPALIWQLRQSAVHYTGGPDMEG